MASKAIIQTPAFKGNKSVLSVDPPSGKIPIISFLFKASDTAL